MYLSLSFVLRLQCWHDFVGFDSRTVLQYYIPLPIHRDCLSLSVSCLICNVSVFMVQIYHENSKNTDYSVACKNLQFAKIKCQYSLHFALRAHICEKTITKCPTLENDFLKHSRYMIPREGGQRLLAKCWEHNLCQRASLK